VSDAPTTTLSERVRAFLAQPLFAAVASLDPDGSPRQALVWYRIDERDDLWLNSREGRRWPANLARDGRVAIAVTDPQDGYRWVGLTGRVVEVVEDVVRARDDIVGLAHRYHPEGISAASEAAFRSQPRVMFRIEILAVHDHLD
jgi:PPOX class probable F420-dependent enzyme